MYITITILKVLARYGWYLFVVNEKRTAHVLMKYTPSKFISFRIYRIA